MEKEKHVLTARKKDAIFCILMLIYPLLHFFVFYVIVNASSIAMAFEYWEDGKYIFDWGATNFAKLSLNFERDYRFSYMLRNSTIAFLCSILIGETLALLFSFFIYKKIKGSKFFKIVLFLPSIISALVLALIYQFFVENLIPELWNKLFGIQIDGLMTSNNTQFITILVYSVFIGFGPKVLIYSSTMSGINDSIVESAQLDGITFFKEFVHITLPMIFATIETFLVASIATFFTNQLNLFVFLHGEKRAELYTFGYYLFIEAQEAATSLDFSNYPYMALIGIIMSVIAIPVSLTVKKLLEKFGPSEN